VRILAVDFGEKRIGLATSDASGSVATPRRTLARKDDAAAAESLKRFCEEEEIGLVIFGVPRRPGGEESDFAVRVRSFAKKFAKLAALPVCFHEETLTSYEAARRAKGPPRGRQPELDAEAAAVLLEDFLQHHSRSGGNRG
jgi:putative Holliday junction resolvase